jgi:2-dehydro-3-deoxyphosphogluconate aldolase/(4S)-4-hydroxy-2-oxoglutarate aldolase
MRAWFGAGVACVGMGSKLVRKDWVAAGDYESIRETAARTLELIQEIRTEHPIFY